MNGQEFSHGSFPVSSTGVPEDCYPSLLKYINDMLMEEDLEDLPSLLQDSLALQATEKSLYDVLGEEYPTSPHHFPSCSDQNNEGKDQNFTPNISVDSCNTGSNNLAKSSWILGQVELESSPVPSSDTYSPQNTSIISNLHREIQPFSRINGVGRSASKSCLHSHSADFSVMNEPSRRPDLEQEKVERYHSPDRTRGRRNRPCANSGYLDEGRSNKYSVVSESAQLELLDDEFLRHLLNDDSTPCPLYDQWRDVAGRKIQQNEELHIPDLRMKRLAHNTETDLWTLLIQCAQAAGTGDQTTASELLKMIRIHSSPIGDANQRLAHYFANGLEARLNGTGMLFSRPLVGRSTSADILKALQLSVSMWPFLRVTNRYTNRVIVKLSEKATRIHIIDFGIGYGFQWPCFIHYLSTRPSGPPKIRITGIELPQPGFRPAERVQETGRRLKRLANSFNLPFEYNAIAQKWETIRYEDLKIDRDDEVIAVNCMYRMKNLPDDTTSPDSPRDAVLKLIKRINPDVFLHGVSNGSFNAPFFVTRFREALFHYSALFDMFEATTAPEDQKERLVYEREFIGREAINVIACEGMERVERPETYKQWQSRNLRIGFRQLPLDQELYKRAKSIKHYYHKDFDIDDDGRWLLVGWKGRITHAISVWKTFKE